MHAKKRIQERKNNSSEGKTLHEYKVRPQSAAEKALGVQPTIIISDDAEKANRLNRIRMVNIRKAREEKQ